mmetsp:Transcript_30843/g.73466  ORF Transcript_30843/g.73466 Transcript_30843/m.73466 type:complete len:285 (-) Transcript_30843:258-1112(-)
MSGQLLYCNANELPKSLKEMEKELLCRYRVKELDTRFDRAISQARSPYSFMRERALLQLCGTLLQASGATLSAGSVGRTLNIWASEIVGVAFESLKRFEAGGASQSGPLTAEGLRDGEEEAAIRALEGLALLLPPSCELMVERGLLSWLAGSFHRWRADRACSALDALLAMQMRSERAQRQFAEAGGLLKVGRLLTDAQAAPQLKRRGLEFLALLMQEAVPKPTPRHMLRPLENAIGKEAAAKLLERKLNLDESEDDIIRLHTEVAPLLKKGNAVLDWFQQLQA